MKIALKDHRGFFGTTWDGQTLVFNRSAVGPGELFELYDANGNPIVIEPVPPQPTDPPPSDDWPSHIVPRPDASYVAECKAYLAAQNPDFSGPCGAWRITHMVAWGLRYQGWGLVNSQPPHNNCRGYKVDVVMRSSDGQWVDMIASAETANNPAWNVGSGPMPASEFRPAPVWP